MVMIMIMEYNGRDEHDHDDDSDRASLPAVCFRKPLSDANRCCVWPVAKECTLFSSASNRGHFPAAFSIQNFDQQKTNYPPGN